MEKSKDERFVENVVSAAMRVVFVFLGYMYLKRHKVSANRSDIEGALLLQLYWDMCDGFAMDCAELIVPILNKPQMQN